MLLSLQCYIFSANLGQTETTKPTWKSLMDDSWHSVRKKIYFLLLTWAKWIILIFGLQWSCVESQHLWLTYRQKLRHCIKEITESLQKNNVRNAGHIHCGKRPPTIRIGTKYHPLRQGRVGRKKNIKSRGNVEPKSTKCTLWYVLTHKKKKTMIL